jgi:hypothetical protein
MVVSSNGRLAAELAIGQLLSIIDQSCSQQSVAIKCCHLVNFRNCCDNAERQAGLPTSKGFHVFLPNDKGME